MKRFLLLIGLLAAAAPAADACTNLIVTRGASTDGSVLVSYAADSHALYGALYQYLPNKAMTKVTEWDTGRYLGLIPQAATTYSTIGNMNSHSLIIAETTYGGRPELADPEGKIDYGSLIYITLQRAKTAREAIRTIAALAGEHGYCSSGESFSIADRQEAWIMELIGKGPADKGIVWVARRIPDGYISGHANQARITSFPWNDPENCLYSPDVAEVARKHGWFTGADKDFSFADAYAPADFGTIRGCDARVWSFFNRFATGMDTYLKYAMGDASAARLPLWVRPAQKIAPKQVFDAMRDHYEGTPMDMTTDIGAGGSHLPYRWRPMEWEIDGQKYLNERAIATQQTGFWFVAQARPWAPADMGILWFGVDDAATSALFPVYCSATEVPAAWSVHSGTMLRYSPGSAFWLFNRVTNFAYLRYDMIAKDIRATIDRWENEQLSKVAEREKVLAAKSAKTRVKELTKLTVAAGDELFRKWQELDGYLLVKYVDGNLKSERDGKFVTNGFDAGIPGEIQFPGYDEKWRRAVAADNTLLKYGE